MDTMHTGISFERCHPRPFKLIVVDPDITNKRLVSGARDTAQSNESKIAEPLGLHILNLDGGNS